MDTRYYRYTHPFLESSSALSSSFTVYSHDQGNWVILKFGELKNLSEPREEFRWAFRLKFFPKNPRDVPQLKAFQRLLRWLRNVRGNTSHHPSGSASWTEDVWMSTYWSGGPVAGGINLEMLKTVMCPSVRVQAARRGYRFEQDGALVHVTPEVIDFLRSEFGDRPLSRRTQHHWPVAILQSGFVLLGLWPQASQEPRSECRRPESMN